MNPLPPPHPPPAPPSSTLHPSSSPDRSRQHPSQPVPSGPSLDNNPTNDEDDSGSDASSVTSDVTAFQPPNNNPPSASGATTAAAGLTIRPPRTSSIAPSNASNISPIDRHPPSPWMSQNELSARKGSGRGAPSDVQQRHRSRHHSQGFFEPSLPTATSSEANLSTSRIAAQAAMQHQQSSSQYLPKRPQIVSRASEELSRTRRDSGEAPPLPPPKPDAAGLSNTQQSNQNGVAGHANVATTADRKSVV